MGLAHPTWTGLTEIFSLADLTNINFFLQRLDPTFFPGLPPLVQVHEGFAIEHAK
jgi:hypothetical protein